MHRIACLSFVVAFGLLASGCSMMAPQYSASIENVQKLKDAGGSPAKVGKFDSMKDQANANPISLRGSTLSSPYENSYAAYLGEAIRQELSLAGRLKPDSDIEIAGVLQKNDLDASGFNTGVGDIEARFVVRKGDAVRYDQVKKARSEWESSFLGSVAIPRAQQEYPRLVQRLLEVLYSDRSFLDALK